MYSNMDSLSATLKEQAVGLGLCRQWTNEWEECDQQELIDKFKKGIDFCLLKQFPSPDFIKRSFDSALLRENLIFVNEDVYVDDAPSGVYVFNGDCSGEIHFKGWSAATLYLRHGTSLSVTADDFAKVFVRLYDDSDVNTECGADASLKVYHRHNVGKRRV